MDDLGEPLFLETPIYIYIHTLLSEIVPPFPWTETIFFLTSRWEPMVFHEQKCASRWDWLGWLGWFHGWVWCWNHDCVKQQLGLSFFRHEKRASFHVENRKSPLTILKTQAFVADFPHVSFEEKKSCKFKSHSWISLVMKWTMILTVSGSVGWRWHITSIDFVFYHLIHITLHYIYIHLFRSFLFTSYCIDFDTYCFIFWNYSQYIVLYHATSILHHSCHIILH